MKHSSSGEKPTIQRTFLINQVVGRVGGVGGGGEGGRIEA